MFTNEFCYFFKQDGQLVSNTVAEEDLRTIRGDKITWVKGTESGCSNIGYLINQVYLFIPTRNENSI